MPLKLNVGLSRKVTEDYNSRGFSLNIEGELPADTMTDPQTLAGKVQQMFQLADDLLEQQVQEAIGATRDRSRGGGRENGRSNGHPYRNGRTRGNGYGKQHRNGDRLITQAQTKAVQNMAKRIGWDPETCAYDEFGVALAELTVKQASDLIDILKKQIESDRTEGARR